VSVNEATYPRQRPSGSAVDGRHGEDRASWAFLPGAGGGATLWQPVAEEFGGTVTALPALDSVHAIADRLEPSIRIMPGPRILVGNSLGALVALELAQRLPVAGLMLVAAGWDFPVSTELIRRVEARGRQAFAESARRCVSPGSPIEAVATVVADFESREAGTMSRHLRAIRDHRPRIDGTIPQPTTLVLRGGFDRSVSLDDHLALAERTGGALIPVSSAGHMPFVDHAEEVIRWLRRLEAVTLRS
jgi:pimeloyl-ACP methyl ester carboxylesterase